jgi:hypothetical protein
MNKLTTIFTIALVFAISSTYAAVEQQPAQVSLVQLIATPERFEGKLISVIGFLELSRESSVLYLRDEDYKHVILMNGVWLDRNETMRKDMNLKYVKIVGVFRTGLRNAGFLAGGITNVKTCLAWSDLEHPRIETRQDSSERRP